jgi:hypothetical protein
MLYDLAEGNLRYSTPLVFATLSRGPSMPGYSTSTGTKLGAQEPANEAAPSALPIFCKEMRLLV